MSKRQERIEKTKALWADISWDEVATYIGPNADAYKPTWEKNYADILKQGYPRFGLSWSWPAFIPILGIPWAAARRQWLFVGLMVGVIILANILMAFTSSSSFGFMMFLVPIMAKNFYVQTAVAKISKIKTAIPDHSSHMKEIQAAGGLNMTSGYIAGAICFVLLALSIWSLISDG